MIRWIRAYLYVILIYGVCVGSGSFWLSQRIRFHGVKDWPSVPARIIDSGNNSYSVRSEYWDGSKTRTIDGSYAIFEYSVGDRSYVSDLPTPDGGGLPLYPTVTFVNGSGQRESPAREWKAFYNPSKPSTAVLVPVSYQGTMWLYTALVSGLLVVIHLACTLPEKLEWLRWRRLAAKRKA
jgi:hypothetical protein